MGYDIHITRAPSSWADNGGHEIRAEEWLTYVAKDPELRLDGANGPYFAIWSGPAGYEEPWFDWMKGNISTKNPDPAIVGKALLIASRLGARVQGDDDEIYLPGGQVERDGVVDSSPGMDWRTW